MSTNILEWLLRGEHSHADPARSFDDLPWELTGERPGGAPHSIFRLLNHMRYWQETYLRRLAGEDVPAPPGAEQGWPGPVAPGAEAAWAAAVDDFRRGLARAHALAAGGDLESPLEHWGGINRAHGLALLAAHNAYHTGQVVLLRRMLGAWPVPGVGDTW